MELVDDKMSVEFRCWKCLDTNKCYQIRSSTTTFDLKKPSYLDKAHLVIDEIMREDGVRKTLTRTQLKKRFNNVEQIESKL
jgi:hypothetical protein